MDRSSATRPTSASTPGSRHAQVGAFYAANATRLRRQVIRRAGVSDALAEDASQTAWLKLLRRPDVPLDRSGLAWLTTVAIRDAWALAGITHDIPVGTFITSDEPGTVPEPAGPTTDPADVAVQRSIHDGRVGDLALLKPRERRDLYLHALGYSYREIAALTGSTYTAVNRRISEGRAQLRAMRDRRV